MSCKGPHSAPWVVELGDDPDEVWGIYGQPCDESCTGRIVQTDCGHYPPEKADAERIVEAVNSLAEAMKIMEDFGNPSDELHCGVCYSTEEHDADCAVILRNALMARLAKR